MPAPCPGECTARRRRILVNLTLVGQVLQVLGLSPRWSNLAIECLKLPLPLVTTLESLVKFIVDPGWVFYFRASEVRVYQGDGVRFFKEHVLSLSPFETSKEMGMTMSMSPTMSMGPTMSLKVDGRAGGMAGCRDGPQHSKQLGKKHTTMHNDHIKDDGSASRGGNCPNMIYFRFAFFFPELLKEPVLTVYCKYLMYCCIVKAKYVLGYSLILYIGGFP